MKLVVATQNKGKLTEIRYILRDLNMEIVSMEELLPDTDIEETGKTFQENAYIKAKTVCDLTGLAALGDDSGLCVDALSGAPGIYTARYAGEPCDSGKNIDLLLKNLKDVPDSLRSAKFVSAVCIVFPDGTHITAQGECAGRIGHEKMGQGGFGYDPVFYPQGYDKTFAQLPSQTKDKISHRYNALCNLEKILKNKGYFE